MPKRSTARPFLGEFEYTTVTYLRDQELIAVSVTDENARLAIQEASRRINMVTSQWFEPVTGIWTLNGEDNPIIHDPDLIPILFVREIGTGVEPTDLPTVLPAGISVLDPATYTVKHRHVENIGATFASGVSNVFLNAVMGWLDDYRVIQVVLAAPLATGDTSAELDDVTGIQPRDILLFTNDDGFHRIRIETIDVGTNTVTFDEIVRYGVDFDIGDSAEVFGKTPRIIERACALLAVDIVNDFFGTATGPPTSLAFRLIRERTDNYEYELSGPRLGGSGSTEHMDNTTGNPIVDAMLTSYVAPPYVGFA